MAVTINSNGTITGIAAGGLPDGVVDADTLAADAVTAAKVADDVINSEHLVDGGVDNAHLATGIASSKLSGALPAISGASLTGISGGPFIRAYLNSTQSNLTNNVFTKVLLNGESYDTANEFDPSTNYRWTCGTAGKYLATANLTWDSGGIVQDKRHKVMIYKNGAQTSHNEIFTAQGSEFSMCVTDVYDMSASDYLEMWCWHMAGVNTPDLQAGAQTTWFAIARIL